MSEKTIDLTALGQAIDTSWGRSSMPLQSSYGVKLSFGAGATIIARIAMNCNFGRSAALLQRRDQLTAETESVVKALIKKVKDEYKADTAQSLNLEKISDDSDVQILGAPGNGVRNGVFRRTIVFQFS